MLLDEDDLCKAFFGHCRENQDCLLQTTNGLDHSAKGMAVLCPKPHPHLAQMIVMLAGEEERGLDEDALLLDLVDEMAASQFGAEKNLNFPFTDFLTELEAKLLPDGRSPQECIDMLNSILEELSVIGGRPKSANHAESSSLHSNTATKRNATGGFITARQALVSSAAASSSSGRPAGTNSQSFTQQTLTSSSTGKSLGPNKRTRINNPKSTSIDLQEMDTLGSRYLAKPSSSGSVMASSNSPVCMTSNSSTLSNSSPNPPAPVDERLAGLDPRLIEMIQREMVHKVDQIGWDDVAGLEHAKNTIKEIVVWPMLRPDIFTGLRGPPKGLLLFGPPGTGKTLIGKCIAGQAKATFFSISASSLTSKWVGEGEKMVRTLFAVARCHQPAVIFVDEIDSLLTQRSEGEVEDGAGTSSDDRILLIGATNRPQEIDEAARRRLQKRLYISLPDGSARSTIIQNLLRTQRHQLSPPDLDMIVARTEGYSGADMDGLCREAALGPIRSIRDQILEIDASQVRPIERADFEYALTQVRASVSQADLAGYLEWNRQFGSMAVTDP